MNKENLVVAGVVLALVFSGFALFGGVDGVGPQGDKGDRGERGLGGTSGPEYYGLQLFNAGHVDGGLYVATTTIANQTGLVTEIIQRSGYVRYLDINADEATVYTFVASSSLTHFLPTVGSCWNMMIENSGDSTLTLAGGSGTILSEPDGQNVVIGVNNFAKVEFCRMNDTDFIVVVDELIPG